MKIKRGVSVCGLKPEIIVALMVAVPIWISKGQELVITSGTDGEHSANSRHFIGMAVDLRTRYFSQAIAKIVSEELQEGLGTEYYVVLESNHIHMQYNG